MSLSTRRELFQRGSTALAIGMAATSLSRQAHGAEEQRIRIGIIGRTGKGDYGHGVDVAFTKVPQAEIVALADEDAAGRDLAAQRTRPQQTYADYREMLSREKLDIVAICPRWADQHHDMIVAAAHAGCHIYMEKPFCPTLAECDSAIEALKEQNLKLGIAHIAQYSPVLEVVKSLIASDEIGEVLEIRARGKEDQRGGGEDLWVLGSHVLAMMRTLAGGDALSCRAEVTHQERPITRADVVDGPEGLGLLAGDSVHACYAFPSGTRGYFASRRGMAASPSRFAIQVYGSKGIIEVPSGYLVNAYILRDGSWSPGRSSKHWEPISSAGIGKPEPRTDAGYEGGHLAAISDLLDAIRDDRPTKCSAEDCRSVVEMIAAIYESQRTREAVRLPLTTRVNPLTLMT